MALDDPRTLVSTDWLAAHMKDPDLRILDATYFMPGDPRDAKAAYDAAHIPGARYFDIDEISDHRSDLPHMAPPVEKFMSRMRAMGVGDGHQVVVYDAEGLFSAARVWWLFRLMGQMDIAVLDGGFPKWLAEGREVEDMAPMVRDRHMTVRRQNQMVKDVTQVSAASKLGDYEIVDARAAERFAGEVDEPRPGLRKGHIPGSKSLPFKNLLKSDGTMLDPDALRAAFAAAGVDLSKPVITTCGSGVTAAILSLARQGGQVKQALQQIGANHGITDEAEFDACLENSDIRRAISASVAAGDDAGVNATPTLFLNGEQLEGYEWRQWPAMQAMLDEALGEDAPETATEASMDEAETPAMTDEGDMSGESMNSDTESMDETEGEAAPQQ